MKLKKNKLWASVTTSEMLAYAEKFKHFRATSRHILIISPKKPKGFVEIKSELAQKLPAEDLAWILSESEELREEEAKAYNEELLAYNRAFLARMEAELQKAAKAADLSKEGLTDAGADREATTEQ